MPDPGATLSHSGLTGAPQPSMAGESGGQVGTFAVRPEMVPAVGFWLEREDAERHGSAVSTTPGPGMPEDFGMAELAGIPIPELPDVPTVAELLEQVRKQQADVERIQRGVEAMEVTGGSRRGEVRVSVRGNGQVTRVIIDPDALAHYDVDELGDLITEAANDSLRKVAEASSEQFRPFMEATSQAGEL